MAREEVKKDGMFVMDFGFEIRWENNLLIVAMSKELAGRWIEVGRSDGTSIV
ncbi:hypothetical protein [Paenibacillus xylanexedens]|uniref:hypothetical protein n=1 Tax=Paenibacillus xylanexedens TaxID=528191 RepID=UPI0016429400|nr:hypothetical protein [Paenibacillus xylanexedens]